MAQYCVNREKQDNGDHEVHNLEAGCRHLPLPANRFDLGEHASCASAVTKAKLVFAQSNGCYYCARPCHTS